MKKTSKIVLVSLAVIAIGGGVLAYGASHKYCSNVTLEERADMFNYHISRKLDLNTIQESNLESLTSKMVEIGQQLKQQRSERQAFVDGLIGEGPLDQQALLQKIGEKTEWVNQSAPDVVALIGQFIDSLDAGQKAELRKMIEKRSYFGGHRGFLSPEQGGLDYRAW